MVMHDVTPLRKPLVRPVSPSKSPSVRHEPPKKSNARAEPVKTLKDRVVDPVSVPKKHHLVIGGRTPGLDNTQWRRLSRGDIRVDARLDLHGYYVQDAFDELVHFMHRARSFHWRCVEIVTGLGSGNRGGTIRRELPAWLQRGDIRPMILAVVHTHHANQGAVRILLKKVR
ncbi:DNA mismatch repair protein MutS [Saccharibacter sp. 17.LH.SD]|nr:DNA mismatch repair protein MutS [Saccharibacter sp. 17.LH.SD]